MTNQSTLYNDRFYDRQSDGSRQSAQVILPLILKKFSISSVVDIGCGTGEWLRVLEENGINDCRGYDGNYVDQKQLSISKTKFFPVDLKDESDIGRSFDLALSLEVAEHIPAEYEERFIERLTSVAPIVLFSAAIPGQQGVNHVNERWQDHWRKLFFHRGYLPVDLVRPQVWGQENVDYWYQQNTILYCKEFVLLDRPDLTITPQDRSLDCVHPVLYRKNREEAVLYVSRVFKELPSLTWAAIKRRFRH